MDAGGDILPADQAVDLHAKLDELLKAQSDAQAGLPAIDEAENIEIYTARQKASLQSESSRNLEK